ncbi:uroporphyrinogen-III C-methyltransferase [Atopomonas sediminilitoris]|uniref:uroporphyrinogen-III C-methyltransferase n=1 Tax=Atopomonas sediminilitoris TaxID=2919919 RepID=UPI001F4D8E7C|nr:uroporphyrinogen-III C-methyltransferase [Atopomonas sediminilitoris]MCJ8170849.1 uroporphyrinogen-III C-methyltransferase [Atopomonas sediminilitoris]
MNAAPPSFDRTLLRPGEVALVGAGPGDPGLLTLRAWQLLQQADVVVYDRLVSDEIMNLVPGRCVRRYVGKAAGLHSLPQDEINQLLVDLAREHQRVLRLKGGDPFVFGRGGEELEHLLANGIVCQLVPGVTAASGCTTLAGIPLTHRNLARSCQFITGHLQADGELELAWAQLAQPQQTLVFYMGLGSLPIISRELIANGLPQDMPAALISHGCSQKQSVLRTTLAQLPYDAVKAKLKPPTLIVIGDVVGLFSQAQVKFPGRLQQEASTCTA